MTPTTRISATTSQMLGRGARASIALQKSCSVVMLAPCQQLILRMQAQTKDRSRTPVPVIGGVDDQLIIEGDLRSKPRKAVIGFEDIFIAGMRQLAIADQDAQSSGVEKRLVDAGDAVHDTGD